MRKFQFLVPFLLVLMPHVTQAQVNDDGLIVATCTNGQGCSCYLSDATLAVLETQVSTPPPDGVAQPVLVYIDGTISWSDRSGHEVDMIYGGDGLCDPEIFTPSDWQPRDGVWLMAIERQELEGCPPQIASAMSIASEIGLTERRTITWPHPFSPAPLAGDNPLAHEWTDRGGGRWSSRIIDESSDIGAFARVTYQVHIRSQSDIAFESTFQTNALAVVSGGTCTSRTFGSLRFDG